MSIFGNIVSKIFGHHAAAAPETAAAPASPAAVTPDAPSSAPTGNAAPEVAASAAPINAAPATASIAGVDVEAVLTNLAAHNKEKLDWRKSIVDLMKLLDLDSSLTARKELAGELHYTGNTEDSATMNIWLHKQVMLKLAENGGKVPDELKH
jgi:membrane-bound ClpP family serine protease